jgi:hypothetical protein
MQDSKSTTFTNRTLFVIAVKVMGLYLVVRAILSGLSSGMVMLNVAFQQATAMNTHMLIQFYFVAELVIGLILLLGAGGIARRAIQEEKPFPLVRTGPTVAWYQLALALFGVWLLALRLPRQLVELWWTFQSGAGFYSTETANLATTVILTVMLGLFFLLSNARLAAWLHRLHGRLGVQDEEPSDV